MLETDLQHLHVLGALLSVFGVACVLLAVDMVLGHRRAARLAGAAGYEPPPRTQPEFTPQPRADEAEEDARRADDEEEERKAREAFWRREEAGFIAYAKGLSDYEGEPFAYTFVPFAGGMGIAALFDSRVFAVQSGARRCEVHFSQVREFKFVHAGRGRFDLHIMVSSLDTPRLIVGQLDQGAMDRWNEIYLRVQEGRI